MIKYFDFEKDIEKIDNTFKHLNPDNKNDSFKIKKLNNRKK